MKEKGAYGQRLADIFRLASAPVLVMRSLQKTKIAVTEIKCDLANNGLTTPIPRENAFLVTIQLRDCPRHDLWIDHRQTRTGYLRAGMVSIYDLRANPMANGISPFHSLHFYMPRAALDIIADMEGCGRVDEIKNVPGLGADDPCLSGLGAALLPALRRPEEADLLFVDHLTIAAAAQALKAYGVGNRSRAPQPIGLAAWQEQCAKEVLTARFDGNVLASDLATDLASECGMPSGAFLRAFRQSTGVSPYGWLLQRRIEQAKALLTQNLQNPLGDVALACGFASESHFVRVFEHITGVHPETWRHG